MHPSWPLDPEHVRLVHELGVIIAKAGTWRFLHGPIVAAGRRDYPDRWEPSGRGVARALARTLWHAHLDLDVTLEDVRSRQSARKTSLQLVRIDHARAVFRLAAIGNDNVAGILATEVGRAFVARLSRDGSPMRATWALPDTSAGTLAAVYLGLGVIATNASRYVRAVPDELDDRATEIDRIGGMPSEQLAFLLAVQATVRDDVVRAIDTLAPEHAARVAAWRDVLDDHEAELRRLLEIEVGHDEPVSRPKLPREVRIESTSGEPVVRRANEGNPVRAHRERYPFTTAFLWCLAAFVISALLLSIVGDGAVMLIGPVLGAVGGLTYGFVRKSLRCSACGCFLRQRDTTCRLCGGRIVDDDVR